MEGKTRSFTCTSVHKKVFGAAIILLLLAALVFSIFYLINDHQRLSAWYINLGDCFYRQQQWSSTFFTPEIKNKGNVFAGISALIAIAGIIYLVINRHKYTGSSEQFSIHLSRNTVYWYLAVVVLAAVLGVWEWRLLSPAYDEVFSAVNCAEMPLFRTMSYYMLPNNHMGYNAINNVLFGWYGDFVASGRLISLIAYMGAMVSVFYFLYYATSNRFYAFVALIPVSLQFQTWGFSAQARGYELMLLCGWVAILSLIGYVRNNKLRYLSIGIIANGLGFILIPSYMYLYLAQLLYMFLYQVYKRRWDTRYLKSQIVMGLAVYIWYTPALCFSGLEAFTDNKWVKPLVDNVWAFMPGFWLSFTRFINDCFCGSVGFSTIISYIVFITPVLLLFTKSQKNRHIAVLYITLWVSYILYSFVLLLTPFHRALIIHFSITIACCAYAYYVFITFVTDYISVDKLRTIAKTIAFAVPVFLYAIYQFSWNTNNAAWAVYGYDVNATYYTQTEGLKQIPVGSTVSFSDEAFFFYYNAGKMNYKVNRCGSADAQYYIKSEPEVLPVSDRGAYKFVAGCGDDYAIYMRE